MPGEESAGALMSPYPPSAYDEDAVLRVYVWSHCQHLMTDVERRANLAEMFAMKAAGAGKRGSVAMARRLEQERSRVADPEVEAALADGFEVFRDRVTRRLLEDPAVQALINRCPKCGKVTRTPKARQCPWCKHDWHGGPAHA